MQWETMGSGYQSAGSLPWWPSLPLEVGVNVPVLLTGRRTFSVLRSPWAHSRASGKFMLLNTKCVRPNCYRTRQSVNRCMVRIVNQHRVGTFKSTDYTSRMVDLVGNKRDSRPFSWRTWLGPGWNRIGVTSVLPKKRETVPRVRKIG